MEKPILAPQLSIIIDDLFVYLNPNVGKFENEFMRLIADDKSTWDKIKIDSSTITISERRLKVSHLLSKNIKLIFNIEYQFDFFLI